MINEIIKSKPNILYTDQIWGKTDFRFCKNINYNGEKQVFDR